MPADRGRHRGLRLAPGRTGCLWCARRSGLEPFPKGDEMRPKLLGGLVLGTIILGATGYAGNVQATPAHNAVTLWNERTQPVLATWTGRGNAAQAYTGSLVQIA